MMDPTFFELYLVIEACGYGAVDTNRTLPVGLFVRALFAQCAETPLEEPSGLFLLTLHTSIQL